MIPILFEPSDTVFNSNGIGRLSDAISCKVKEARNGFNELNMVYPLNGVHFKDLVKSGIIYGKPSARRGNQAFTIEKISRPINGRVSIFARHIRNRMGMIPVSPFSAGSLSAALAAFKTNAAEACPFTLSADFESSSSYAVPVPAAMLSYLGGQRGSILDVYGGEWEFDNWSAILHRNRGQDNGYRIIYGKNLVDLKQEENILNTYTGIYPYWQSEETMVTLPEKVVHSAAAANWPYQRTVVKDFTEAFTNAPTAAQLRSYTESFIQRNDIGKPSVSLSVKWVNAQDTPEYKALLQSNVDLCDTVEVYFSALGVSTKAKIIEYEWDMLQERYDSLEIGDKRETLALTIEEQLKTISMLPTKEQLNSTVDRATGVLNSGRRGHVIINRNAEGWANEILFLDNENLSAAQNVLRINMAGIGFSSTGYQGPYYQSWTMDGHFSLGGVNNAYGDFQILDGSGNPLGEWDKDGLKFYDSAQRILMLLNHSGLFLRDISGNTVAQMTADGLNIYKGTISGVIIDIARGNDIGLYCDGTRFQFGDFEVNDDYGRQILESTDETTGMGGTPDSDGGLYFWAGWHSDNDYGLVVNDAGAYVMYSGQAYNIGEQIHYILTNCCGGGCSSDGCDCDSYGCDDESCPGYGGTGCIPEGAECPSDACGNCDGNDGGCGSGEEVTPCSSCDYAE